MGVAFPSYMIIGTYEEEFNNPNATSGANTAVMSTVPSGQIWVIQGAHAHDATTKNPATSLRVRRDTTDYVVAQIVPTAARHGPQLNVEVYLFPGDAMAFVFSGCTAGDSIWAWAVGYKVGLDVGI